MSAALVAGLLAGYGIAIPVGAVGTYLAALTARTSLRIGACAALGVATADGVYAVVSVLGGTALTPVVEPITDPLRWASALLLIVLAGRAAATVLLSHSGRLVAHEPEPMSGRRAYLGLLGITLLNPMTVIYFAALVLASQQSATRTALDKVVFVVAAFAASASWQLVLAVGGSALGRLLTGPRGRLTTTLLSSATITALALHLLIS